MLEPKDTKPSSIKERVSKLMTIKSIVTLVLLFVYAYLTVRQLSVPDQFITIIMMVLSFYFGTQTKKE